MAKKRICITRNNFLLKKLISTTPFLNLDFWSYNSVMFSYTFFGTDDDHPFKEAVQRDFRHPGFLLFESAWAIDQWVKIVSFLV